MLLSYVDHDGDGHFAVGFRGDGDAWPDGDDCDDDDPAIHPGRIEICKDRVDNDCDGEVDEDGVGDRQVFADRDQDGFGNPVESVEMCEPRPGWVLDANDCNDLNDFINPGVPESCDGIDNDCDGVIDDGAPETPWYRDEDGDSFGDSLDVVHACQRPPGYTEQNVPDCDDHASWVFPGAYDAPYDGVDADCARDNDYDVDRDGYLEASSGAALVDCDDLDASVHPGTPEVWYDGVDQDCDPSTEWDMDLDGVEASPMGDDCDDADARAYPGASESWYDGIDQDCDPATEWDQDGDGLPFVPTGDPLDCDDRDPGVAGPTAWYQDLDRDGWGDIDALSLACTRPVGFVERPGDCDDALGRVNPDGVETCAPGDEDCDGEEDEAGGLPWFPDRDGDGFGDEGVAGFRACVPPEGWVARAGDCDDDRADVNPSQVEICDGVDDDCDGFNDALQGRDLRVELWVDHDGDGVGAIGDSIRGCAELLTGHSRRTGDCDDDDAATFPGAAEPCDGVDNNCADGLQDEGRVDVWVDVDEDGFGAGAPAWICPGDQVGAGRGGDCDDGDASVHPGAAEVCDHVDNDCVDGVDRVGGRDLYVQRYEDADGDGWGSGPPSPVCPGAAGWSVQANDCDDGDPAVFPGAPEPCDGVDNNCAFGTGDEGQLAYQRDEDGDGYGHGEPTLACPGTLDEAWVTRGGDCDDARPRVHPGVPEVCDYVDNNCNGDADELALRVEHWFDQDGDGYGGHPTPRPACDRPDDALVRVSGDCDDADPRAYPRAAELCDEIDQDCDGEVSDDGRRAWYVDVDGDGVGGDAPRGFPAAASYPPVVCASLLPSAWTWVSVDGDCDDGDPSIRPGVVERCDYVDSNCNGWADEAVRRHFVDADGDGKGALGVPSEDRCPGTPGYVENQLDCDDRDPRVYVGAPELCDDVDQDCDGDLRDDGRLLWWYDGDGDGFGVTRSGLSPREVCRSLLPDPARWVTVGGDCDDGDPGRSPGRAEACDTIDNDCDPATPEPTARQYPDRDGDGYGDASANAQERCDLPNDGWVLDRLDCDDRRADVHPGARDVCDDVDRDCDGDPFEGRSVLALIDVDHDGYGDGATLPVAVCPDQLCPLTDAVAGDVSDGARDATEPCWAPMVTDPGLYDCDDDDHATHPNAAEVCDGKRNACNECAEIDPDPACDEATRFEWMGSVYLVRDVAESWSAGEAWCREHGYKLWWPTQKVFFRMEPFWLAAGGHLDVGMSYHSGIVARADEQGHLGWWLVGSVEGEYLALSLGNQQELGLIMPTRFDDVVNFSILVPQVSIDFEPQIVDRLVSCQTICELDGEYLIPSENPRCP
ncbi:MAG TPA: putative metal-binding motif-containing protein [Myxococcota bacterium]|nr:putative metal-binding motif-containing protein [Myxococcota bacterium]